MPDTVFYYDDATSSSSAHTTLTLSSWNTAKILLAMDIGDQVTTIGTNAFNHANANNLRRLYLPKNVTTIQNSAFLQSGNLNRITITNENLTFGTGQVFISGVFKHIVFSDGVTVIKASMMQKLRELGAVASITVSRSVTNIENSAFALFGGTPLGAICFLGNAPTFGSNLFFSPSGNLKIFRSPNSNGWPSTIQGIEVISLTNTAFIYANGYGYSHILSSDTTITSATYGINDGSSTILVHVIFGGTATSIGDNAFYNINNRIIYLTSFTFMDTCILSSIGANGFAALFLLTEIELPNTITSIGSNAFAANYHLQKIKLSNSLTTISSGAFYTAGYYGALSEITLPASVTSLEGGVFIGTPYLKNIYFLGNQPAFSSYQTFIDINPDAKMYRIPGKNWRSYSVQGLSSNKIVTYPVELFYPQDYIFRNRIRSGGTGKLITKGDKDAKDYIRRVEAADGQSLEPRVILAITDFVIGCKADGIWDAIKSSCILAGARTLAGALIPLKGTAPTNNGFLSADYDRATGLEGNGSSKYLNSNRTDNADPQNNQHLAVYSTSSSSSIPPNESRYYIGMYDGCTTSPSYTHVGALDATTQGYWAGVHRSRTTGSITSTVNLTKLGLYGVSRNNSNNYTRFGPNGLSTVTQASGNSSSFNIFVFAANFRQFCTQTPTAQFFMDQKLAFYSIGEALDLSLLKNRVDALMIVMNTLNTFDQDALNYINNVEAADGRSLENSVRYAINDFVVGCKNDGIWDAIKSSCILAGARTLAGALVPLKGAAPTNNNFISTDYNRATGLKGNGSSKYLNSNRADNADPQNDQHMSVYLSEFNNNINEHFIGSDNFNSITRIAAFSTNNLSFASKSSGGQQGNVSTHKFKGISRNNPNNFNFYNSPSEFGVSTYASNASSAFNILIFNNSSFNNGSPISDRFSLARIGFYSIGTSINLSLLNNRITTLMNAYSTLT